MPGLLVHIGAVMTCPHGGQVTIVPATPPRVKVNGAPVATSLDQIVVAGCTQPVPCVKVQWANVSARTMLNGRAVPILLQAVLPPVAPGGGLCTPTGVPPLVMVLQPRVNGM